jgi:hypothetical protein
MRRMELARGRVQRGGWRARRACEREESRASDVRGRGLGCRSLLRLYCASPRVGPRQRGLRVLRAHDWRLRRIVLEGLS